MARIYNINTINILKRVAEKKKISAKQLYNDTGKGAPYKDFYNTIFRLADQELITKEDDLGAILLRISEEGKKLLSRLEPQKDGVWKIIIFDIPEKQKYVRTILRAKLKALHFKKWQNSIWISPFVIDQEIQDELNELGKKFFIRLIKTADINHTDDLKKLFP